MLHRSFSRGKATESGHYYDYAHQFENALPNQFLQMVAVFPQFFPHPHPPGDLTTMLNSTPNGIFLQTGCKYDIGPPYEGLQSGTGFQITK
jgi:hypothetical protein